MPSPVRKIAIVGTGPSAIYTLQALLHAGRRLDIVLFEAGPIAGMGIPYHPDHTHPAMLANIASIEIPPVVLPLADWLRACPAETLAQWSLSPEAICDRAFFPRIVLGAYFRHGLNTLAEKAQAAGHAVEILTSHPVRDIIVLPEGIEVVVEHGPNQMRHRFDTVVIATGHRTPALIREAETWHPPHPQNAPGDFRPAGRIGVLGSSLSAIDVAVATALKHGTFIRNGAGPLSYRVDGAAEETAFHLTLMSRAGLLPEVDFYCPIPYLPLRRLTPEAVQALIETGPTGLLDRAFVLFAKELEEEDPDFSRAIALTTLTPDTFASACFAARTARNPFHHARENLAEARANAQARHTVAWRYMILRAHEVFARLVPHLDASDLARFRQGLQRVFIDNYAAVPPESIERLLALHDAGRLDVHALGADYEITPRAPRGFEVRSKNRSAVFDHVIDARGQSALGIDDLPFATLRMTLKANRLKEAAPTREGVGIENNYRLTPGLNPVENLYFLSIPFLLHHNPFVQGLCSAHEMGEAVAQDIRNTLDKTCNAQATETEALRTLTQSLRSDRQGMIFCLDSGLILYT